MLALRKVDQRAGITLQEVASPTCEAGEVLVAVAAAGICGSDLHVADWSPAYAFVASALPVTLGHEFAGTLVEIGNGVDNFDIGDRVVVMPSVVCGKCEGCLRVGPDGCSHRTGLGMTRNGAFATHVAVPAMNCVTLPDEMEFGLAALTEPLTVSLEAVVRAEIDPDAHVLVMGPGTIGQGIAMLARMAGAKYVTVTGYDDGPRFEALRALGFNELIDMATANSSERLREVAGDGFDVVFEATGVADTVRDGLLLLRNGGTLVISGIHDVPIEIDATAMVRRNLQIRGSYRSPRASWRQVIEMLARDKLLFLPMITHRMPLIDAPAAFALAKGKRASKIIIDPRACAVTK